jgi:hypothetical protein
MSGLSRPLPALLLLVAAGCGSSPREGDTLLLKAPGVLWFNENDLRENRDAHRPIAELGGRLSEGTSLQVLEVHGDALRVRIAEDNADPGYKSLFGDKTGKIGFVPRDVEAVRMAR